MGSLQNSEYEATQIHTFLQDQWGSASVEQNLYLSYLKLDFIFLNNFWMDVIREISVERPQSFKVQIWIFKVKFKRHGIFGFRFS
jgi:hypothetical protein